MLAEFFVNFFNYVPDVPFCIVRLNQFNFYFFFSFSLICIDHKFNLTRVSVFQTLLLAFSPLCISGDAIWGVKHSSLGNTS